MTESEVLVISRQLVATLAYLHSLDVAHRDIKPENILYRGDTVKLCDFDLACENGSACTSGAGTADFLAPEVLRLFMGEGEEYGLGCDLWSLGVTLYILLCGSPPFTGDCGQGCGWEQGAGCSSCLHLLFTCIQENQPNFSYGPWHNISPSCKHFLRGLMTKDPSSRLAAQTALEHPWLTGTRLPGARLLERSQAMVEQSSVVCPVYRSLPPARLLPFLSAQGSRPRASCMPPTLASPSLHSLAGHQDGSFRRPAKKSKVTRTKNSGASRLPQTTRSPASSPQAWHQDKYPA